MSHEVYLVTGANIGIGKATALDLAKRGARVVMLCRSAERGSKAQADIIRQSGNDAVDLLVCDLASPQDIRQTAAGFMTRYDRLSVLINNAGVLNNRRRETAEGLEATFAINHLAPFLLTNLLLPLLKASAPARIVNVSSDAHRSSAINFDDLQSTKKYRPMRAYSQSKIANVLFTYELARRLEGTGITVNALHPGMVATHIGGDGWNPTALFFKLFKPFLRKPAKGAETVLYLATAPEVEGVSGRYFVDLQDVQSAPVTYDEAAACKLWQISAELTGLKA